MYDDDDGAGCTMIERGDTTRPVVVPSKLSEDDRAVCMMMMMERGVP